MKLLYLLRLIWATGFSSIYRVLPSYLASAFSALQISAIYSAYALPKLLSIPSGWLADRFGKRRTLFMAFLFLPLVTFLFTISGGILHYAIMFFLIGLIGNFFHPAISALATIFSEKRTEALFRLESMYQLGVVIGPVIGGFMMFTYGLDAAFLTWTALSLLGLAFSSLLLKGNAPARTEKGPGLWNQLRENKSGFLVFLISGSLLTGLFESIMAITVPIYAVGLGFTVIEVGIIIGIAAAISIFGLTILGRKLESIRKEYSLILTTLLVGFSFLVMALVSSLLGIAILTGVFITGRAGGLNISRAFIADNLHRDIRATGMSFSDTVQYMGRIIGPLFAGFLIDFTGTGPVFISVFVLSLFGSGLLLAYRASH